MTIDVAGLILAGGLSRRMGGGDKPLISVDGQTLLERTIARLRPQVGELLLNANGDPTRFAEFGLEVAADVVDGYGGPLVGVLTGLDWARAKGARWVASAASDTPLFPADLVSRMVAAVAAEGADMAMAVSGGRNHPVFALWPVTLAEDLRRAVIDDNLRKIEAFTDRYRVAKVEWPQLPFDPFFNVNTPEDVVRLAMILDGTLPAEPPLRATLPVAVVVERRDSADPWVKENWRVIEVVLEPPGPDWIELRREPGFEHYLVAAPDLELHRSDLASYRYNLGGAEPLVFAVLRKDEGGPHPVRVTLVTAAPDEAQKRSENGENLVEGLAMPPSLQARVQRFCACHPADERKRKRDRDDAEQRRRDSLKAGQP
jgi:molybdopterin-guanine dinucleotide biosynthesis protein A